MAISKEPEVPALTSEQIKDLTQVVFLEEQEPIPSDVILCSGEHTLVIGKSQLKHTKQD